MESDYRIEFKKDDKTGAPGRYRMSVFSADLAEPVSWLSARTEKTIYCGKTLSTLIVGGVGTRPEYRRRGYVRAMMEQLFLMAPEMGWSVSLLHPFSFAYYNKFKYQRVADHKILEFPLTALDNFPRSAKLARYTAARANDLAKVYGKFIERRNLSLVRPGPSPYLATDNMQDVQAYLYYQVDGEPSGYIILKNNQYFSVNRNVGNGLDVYELVYTSPEALSSLLGFLRIFEGENDRVKLQNVSICPGIELDIRHNSGMQCQIVPDIAGRILDTKVLLEQNDYPEQAGRFRLRVADDYPAGQGVFAVEYKNRQAVVEHLPYASDYDIHVPIDRLCPVLYGYGNYNRQTLAYIPGVEIKSAADDFFRAFPPRPGGIFEHF